MKPCKECGKEVSTSANACPNCGRKRPTGGLSLIAKVIVGVVSLLLIIIVSIVYGSYSMYREKVTSNQEVKSVITDSETNKAQPMPPVDLSKIQLPPKKKYNHKYSITTKYTKKSKFDSSGDCTVVTLKPFYISEKIMFMPERISYDGKKPRIQETIIIAFMVSSKSSRYSSNSELLVLLDYKKLNFINPGYRQSFSGDGEVNEYMFFHLPIQSFIDIANSNSVECKLGDIEFKFKTSQIEALKDFASRMQ